ncbi:DUF4012 domain-containing protein [Pseudarthrobacter sp. B4EP4b]|uniref:DUF4012 domain-containing protein n=1 Tax=Pseudarthrobacter sp. B4EP4b TaxID=2590664 RepID=UPI0021027986|nr:DUF4012 domain-containing protein [Pseudarthrobacter sp. B4EP4b]
MSTLVLLGLATAWLGAKASTIRSELDAAVQLVSPLRTSLAANDAITAAETVTQIRSHTTVARESSEDPLWGLAGTLPVLGANFNAISEVARAADDVSSLGLAPLVKVFADLDWNSLLSSHSGMDLEPLRRASPNVTSAAHAVRESASRLSAIESGNLLPQVAEPLESARKQLQSVTGALDTSADASQLLPPMLGIDSPHHYLVIVQNNAETRASGGIPGALAVLTLDKGKLSLGQQSSASALGVFDPAINVDGQQEVIYSKRLGKYMQDVNLTPDFPTAAATAQGMWESRTGQRVDGVLSIDPVALSYLLEAVGPVELKNLDYSSMELGGLPEKLTSDNVVQTLLSDVYAKIDEPKMQDAYFAAVAQEVFTSLSLGKTDAVRLMTSINKAVGDNRILIWSASKVEQAAIEKYRISGSVAGPSIAPSQLAVYFNDGTGAKMDYYVKRTVQLVKKCPANGYEQTSVRITSTNTAPVDAGKSLPAYVTGGGIFGVPPGTVQTNIVAYGPIQAHVESATIDGQKTPFAPYLHANRPVGVVAQQLAPGDSRTVEFTFGKIVQHTEPNVVVTPTVQSVKDVVLPTENASCIPGQ